MRKRRADCPSADRPGFWGASIIGIGSAMLKYPSGLEVDWMRCGFSTRKDDIRLSWTSPSGNMQPLLAWLGKHRLQVKRLAIAQGLIGGAPGRPAIGGGGPVRGADRPG